MGVRTDYESMLLNASALLSRLGYANDEEVFRRPVGSLQQIIHVTRSRNRAVIYCGVFVPEVERAQTGRNNPQPLDGHLCFNLAAFSNPPCEDIEIVNREGLRELLCEHGCPFLEKMTSREWIVENWRRHQTPSEIVYEQRQRLFAGLSWGARADGSKVAPPELFPVPGYICEAAIKAEEGDLEGAIGVLQRELGLAQRYQPGHAKHLELVAARLRLNLRG